MRKITVTIQPDGTTAVDASGFKGKGCQDATQAIELAIGGGGPSDVKKKPDFFATDTSRTAIKGR